jgi:hypothetical protein
VEVTRVAAAESVCPRKDANRAHGGTEVLGETLGASAGRRRRLVGGDTVNAAAPLHASGEQEVRHHPPPEFPRGPLSSG